MDLPFDLVETVHDVNGKPFIIDTLEKDIFMALPCEREIILNQFFYVQRPIVLEILDILKSLDLCQEYVTGFWILTEKGRILQPYIRELTHPSRLMK
ncbi:hypothetical protein [Nostoc cycadae]|uniref:Uncharacterized protein n=1 Tax=Nostoc cycadae WK-1 TaxID=1861711 RepID=A0A2H6LR48_9NOSO|nr:hypothetical protein [Nostoc cycadae]GBE95697.1 hypothetical protein NCWK1_5485 [Nostoc cycadae WK-1]